MIPSTASPSESGFLLPERDWRDLIRGLQQKSCVLLLGPEVDEKAGAPPLTTQLAAHLAASCRGTMVDPTNLSDAARQYSAEFGRNTLESEVVDFYSNHSQPTAAHRDLASLPFHFIASSCHDERYERAAKESGKRPRSAVYAASSGRGGNLVPQGTGNEPLIYHLCGSIAEPNSLVLTEGNLLSFLISVARRDPPLPKNVSSELQRIDRSFLFLGFGMKHWHLRILLHMFELNRSENRSFAFEPFESRALDQLPEVVFYYRTGYRIEVFNVGVSAFARELRSRYEASTKAPVRLVSSDLPVVPLVFVSYASADREAALKVTDAMRQAGLDPWVDKDGLESGDDWNKVIERRVRESDYFVLIHSKNLAGRDPFGYVFSEIQAALEKQKRARAGTRFLLPLLFDETPLGPELEHIHAETIDGDEAIAKVISSLKRDFQRRNRHGQRE